MQLAEHPQGHGGGLGGGGRTGPAAPRCASPGPPHCRRGADGWGGESPSAAVRRSSATKKAKEKGRAVQLVVKINEFRYRLALFRSSCVTTAIVSGTLDSYISSTPLYNKTLFDLRNKIRLLGFAHPASYICKIILLPARRVHLSRSRCAADVERTCPCLHFFYQMEICREISELLFLRLWGCFFF